jgi:hypothetical protein
MLDHARDHQAGRHSGSGSPRIFRSRMFKTLQVQPDLRGPGASDLSFVIVGVGGEAVSFTKPDTGVPARSPNRPGQIISLKTFSPFKR